MRTNISVDKYELKDVRYKDMPKNVRKDFVVMAIKRMFLMDFSMVVDVIRNRVIYSTLDFTINVPKTKLTKRKVKK